MLHAGGGTGAVVPSLPRRAPRLPLRRARRHRRRLVIARRASLSSALVLALAACSRDESVLPKRSGPTAAPAPPRTASTAASTAAPPPRAPAKPTAPAVTPDARKAYAVHLAAGRKLAADKRWGEATAELDKALAEVPHDPRALLDLGWAAFQAGDVKKAERASREAVRRAPDAATRAKAHYNLGRVAEAEGKRDLAARCYGESLRLRPNETVQRQLDALTKPAPAASAPPATSAAPVALPCTGATPMDELTACLGKATRVDDDDDPAELRPPALVPIEAAPDGLTKRVSIVQAQASRTEEVLLLVASSLRGWSTVAELTRTFNPGAFGISEEASFPRIEIREHKGAKVLWLEVQKRRADSDLGVDEIESDDTRDVVLCLLADERRRETSCPLRLPLATTYKRERMSAAELDDETKRLATPGLPIAREATFSVTIGDDGVVTTRLVKGVADERTRPLLGARRLF